MLFLYWFDQIGFGRVSHKGVKKRRKKDTFKMTSSTKASRFGLKAFPVDRKKKKSSPRCSNPPPPPLSNQAPCFTFLKLPSLQVIRVPRPNPPPRVLSLRRNPLRHLRVFLSECVSRGGGERCCRTRRPRSHADKPSNSATATTFSYMHTHTHTHQWHQVLMLMPCNQRKKKKKKTAEE